MNDASKIFDLLAVTVAGGSTVRAAAAVVGCSESQAYRLSSTSEFKQRVAELRTEAANEAVGQLTKAASKAVATLVEMLDSDYEAPIRLKAANSILSNMKLVAEHAELRDRLDRIEYLAASPKAVA